MKQCKSCPWKKSTRASRDIPGGYCVKRHRDLKSTIAEPGDISRLYEPLEMMACHCSRPGRERTCVGWAANQLGPGNNIALRLKARYDESLHDLQTVGPQHERLEDTIT